MMPGPINALVSGLVWIACGFMLAMIFDLFRSHRSVRMSRLANPLNLAPSGSGPGGTNPIDWLRAAEHGLASFAGLKVVVGAVAFGSQAMSFALVHPESLGPHGPAIIAVALAVSKLWHDMKADNTTLPAAAPPAIVAPASPAR